MIIRAIEPRDDAAMAAIVRRSLEAHGLNVPGTAYFDPELDHLSAHYGAATDRTYFVAEKDGEVVGGAGCSPVPGADGVAELQKLYVAAAWRHRGIARGLTAAVEEVARTAGFSTLYLETHHDLVAAVALYRALGYRESGEPLPSSPHTAMDVFFEKSL